MEILNLPDEVFIARGKYSTINNAIKIRRSEMTLFCTQLQTLLGGIIKCSTSDDPMSVNSSLGAARTLIDRLEESSKECAELIEEKKSLREVAYPV